MDNEELEAIHELQAMSKEDLLNVDHTVGKWHCCIEGCTRSGKILDFGISPVYFWRTRWYNLTHRIFICGTHWKMFGKTSQRNWPIKQVNSNLDHVEFKS